MQGLLPSNFFFNLDFSIIDPHILLTQNITKYLGKLEKSYKILDIEKVFISNQGVLIKDIQNA